MECFPVKRDLEYFLSLFTISFSGAMLIEVAWKACRRDFF